MRCPFAVMLVTLSACNPTSDAPVSRVQQALPALPGTLPPAQRIIEGLEANAQLGASLSACDGIQGGFVAGAPGISSLYVDSLNATVRIVEANNTPVVGNAVLCDRTQGLGLVGGASGLWRALADGGSQLLREGSVQALVNNPGAPVLAGVATKDGGSQLWRVTSPVTPPGDDVTVLARSASRGFASSLAYFPAGERFALGDSSAGVVYLYKHLADGGVEQTQRYDGGVMAGATGKFGTTIAVGNVLPDVGLELIVGSPDTNEVFIFAANGTLLRHEASPTATQEVASGFGSALAVEPRNIGGGLSALWVGEPGTDRVYRCFGLSCEVYENVTLRGTRFGAALAFDRNALLVGAPDYPGPMALEQHGAVLVFEGDGGTRGGEAQYCQLDAGCRVDCSPGVCVGGVLCVPNTRSDCTLGEQCINEQCEPIDAGPPDAGEVDAGVPDAGTPDAGIDGGSASVDAGPPDAGEIDAGEEVDAGDSRAVVFQTGCASAPGVVTMLLLTLLRRRAGVRRS